MENDNDTEQLAPEVFALKTYDEGQRVFGEKFADEANAALDGLPKGEQSEYLKALQHLGPTKAAKVIKFLASHPDNGFRILADAEPAEAYQTILDSVEDFTRDTRVRDALSIAEWLQDREEEIREKSKPKPKPRMPSASSAASDRLDSESWLRARNAELEKKASRWR